MRLFQRRNENFVCEKCSTQVKGSGYTNHCPHCLWSKHLDNNPGDRLNECHGLMKPIGLRKKDGDYDILHHCMKCGIDKWNHVTVNDNSDIIVKLSSNPL